MTENTRFFKKIVPSLRESTTEILDKQHSSGQLIEVPVSGGVECWLHKAKTKNAPVIFEMHGGGFVLGDARKDDAFCEALCALTNANVIGVNYPKAPEHPYPQPVNALWQVMEYFAQNANEFEFDKTKFATIGFSSGGNLAAVMAIREANTENAPFKLCGQVLHYPFLDAVTSPSSKNPQPWDLPAEIMDAFTELYCQDELGTNPEISPVCESTQKLKAVAPALIITAQRDALKDEGEKYAQLLEKSGIEVEYFTQEYAHHGYVEDWFNPAVYEASPDDVRALHAEQFGSSAQMALDKSADFLKRHF